MYLIQNGTQPSMIGQSVVEILDERLALQKRVIDASKDEFRRLDRIKLTGQLPICTSFRAVPNLLRIFSKKCSLSSNVYIGTC